MSFKITKSNFAGSLWISFKDTGHLFMMCKFNHENWQFINLVSGDSFPFANFNTQKDHCEANMSYAGNISDLDIDSYLEEVKTKCE